MPLQPPPLESNAKWGDKHGVIIKKALDPYLLPRIESGAYWGLVTSSIYNWYIKKRSTLKNVYCLLMQWLLYHARNILLLFMFFMQKNKWAYIGHQMAARVYNSVFLMTKMFGDLTFWHQKMLLRTIWRDSRENGWTLSTIIPLLSSYSHCSRNTKTFIEEEIELLIERNVHKGCKGGLYRLLNNLQNKE